MRMKIKKKHNGIKKQKKKKKNKNPLKLTCKSNFYNHIQQSYVCVCVFGNWKPAVVRKKILLWFAFFFHILWFDFYYYHHHINLAYCCCCGCEMFHSFFSIWNVEKKIIFYDLKRAREEILLKFTFFSGHLHSL